MPYSQEWGGGAVKYEVYLQVLEGICQPLDDGGRRPVGVHTMSCYPLASFGTKEQREEWLPDMLGRDLLGAYALSEARQARTPPRCPPAPNETATTTC